MFIKDGEDSPSTILRTYIKNYIVFVRWAGVSSSGNTDLGFLYKQYLEFMQNNEKHQLGSTNDFLITEEN